MTNQEYIQLHDENVMLTYGRFPVVIERAEGVSAWDADGKKYLDMGSGIGTNSLGYCDSKWLEAVVEQLKKVQHVSNYFYTPVAAVLAEKLMKISGYQRVFFGNSGAEANECAIKVARKYSMDRWNDPNRTTIITLQNSFHGRTVTTLAATGQDVFHTHFYPFTEGFRYAEANNMDSVREQFDGSVCAIMVEMIQGEGGVCPLEKSFVDALVQFCNENELLLIADEVQTGVGRTGTFYCSEQFGIQPDILTSAKGLGGGLPIGACLCTEKTASVLTAGTHGSTFGGNPVSLAGALAVVERVGDPEFLKDVQEKGEYLRARLAQMKGVSSVRGMGLMIGADLVEKEAKDVVKKGVENGLLMLTAKQSLRFLPPLTITREEIDEGLAILEKILND